MNSQQTTDQKETLELNDFVGTGINGFSKDSQDGKFLNNFNDHLQTLLSAQPGLQGLGSVGAEAARSTIEDKEIRLDRLKMKMPDVQEDNAYDIAAFLHGNQCMYSMLKRNAKKEAIAEIKAEIAAAKGDLSKVRSLQ